MGASLASFSLLLLSLAAGVAAAWENLFSPEYKKRASAWLTLSILVCSLGIQGYREQSTRTELESVDRFFQLQEKLIDEASGAAALNGRLFVVDDEKRNVYEYRYERDQGKAVYVQDYRIRASRQTQSSIRPEIIDKVDDLEAAAAYRGRLYLVSSHSSNKKGERELSRELFLEIDGFEVLQDNTGVAHVTRATTLTSSVEQALSRFQSERNGRLIETDGRLNIEGLAVDANGNAYLGLRNPLLQIDKQKFALVLRMAIEQMFSEAPDVHVMALRLEDGGKNYGITSLDYDQTTGQLLVLGNSPQKDEFFWPKLWVWRPDGQHAQTPGLVKTWSLKVPERFRGKPEAVVLHADQGFVFIDAFGHGGQRVFRRDELGLANAGGR